MGRLEQLSVGSESTLCTHLHRTRAQAGTRNLGSWLLHLRAGSLQIGALASRSVPGSSSTCYFLGTFADRRVTGTVPFNGNLATGSVLRLSLPAMKLGEFV